MWLLKWPINYSYPIHNCVRIGHQDLLEMGRRRVLIRFRICIWVERNCFPTVLSWTSIQTDKKDFFRSFPRCFQVIWPISFPSCLSRPLFPFSYGTHLSPLCEGIQKSDGHCSWLQCWLNAPQCCCKQSWDTLLPSARSIIQTVNHPPYQSDNWSSRQLSNLSDTCCQLKKKKGPDVAYVFIALTISGIFINL